MKTRVPDYFKKFQCIADKCEDTCCAGWGIVIDDESFDYYKSVQGKFGERLKSEIMVDEDNDRIFKLKGKNCAFLNKNNMCDIYSNLGEEHLCYTCKMYPRFVEEFGNLREMGLSLSCEEAARLILESDKKAEFEISEDDGLVIECNDDGYEISIQLVRCRKEMLKILQNRDMNFNERLALIFNFALDIQDKIDDNKIEEIESVRKNYSENDFVKNILLECKTHKTAKNKKFQNIIEYFKVYIDLQHINESYPETLKNCIRYLNESNKYSEEINEFENYYEERMYEYEHLVVYFLYRYFMKSVYDYDVSSKVKLAIISYILIKQLNVVRWIENSKKFEKKDQVDVMHMYSKDIEHCDENIEELYNIFESNDIFCYEELMSVIMN